MNSKLVKRREINMKIFNEYKKKRANGEITEQAFKKNFPRGCVAGKGSAAYKAVDKEYRAWLKASGFPPPGAKKKSVSKKTSKKVEKKEAPKQKKKSDSKKRKRVESQKKGSTKKSKTKPKTKKVSTKSKK